MTDYLESVRQALEAWNKWKGYMWSAIPSRDWEQIARGLAAARRFLALTETGQRVEWCEVHDHEAGPIYGPDALLTSDECWRQVWTDDYDFDQLCRTDTRLVIPANYLTEEGDIG